MSYHCWHILKNVLKEINLSVQILGLYFLFFSSVVVFLKQFSRWRYPQQVVPAVLDWIISVYVTISVSPSHEAALSCITSPKNKFLLACDIFNLIVGCYPVRPPWDGEDPVGEGRGQSDQRHLPQSRRLRAHPKVSFSSNCYFFIVTYGIGQEVFFIVRLFPSCRKPFTMHFLDDLDPRIQG